MGRKNVCHVHVAVISDLNMLSVGAHGDEVLRGCFSLFTFLPNLLLAKNNLRRNDKECKTFNNIDFSQYFFLPSTLSCCMLPHP